MDWTTEPLALPPITVPVAARAPVALRERLGLERVELGLCDRPLVE